MKLLASLAAALSLMAVVPALAQGQDFSKIEEVVTNLGHDMYAVTGAGGNTTVAAGKVDRVVAGCVAISDNVGGVMFKDMAEVMEFSKLLAATGTAMPKHLRGNVGGWRT